MTNYTLSKHERLAREGEEYVASHRYEDLADTSTASFFLDNTDGNADFVRILITPGGDGRVTITKNVTEDSAGSAATQTNKRADLSGTGGIDAKHGGSYSSGTVVFEGFLSGGEKKASAGGQADGPSFVLPSGENVLIEVTNVSGSANDYGIATEYHEPPNE